MAAPKSGEDSDNDWLMFDDGDDLHPAAIIVAGIGVLRVANARFCKRKQIAGSLLDLAPPFPKS